MNYVSRDIKVCPEALPTNCKAILAEKTQKTYSSPWRAHGRLQYQFLPLGNSSGPLKHCTETALTCSTRGNTAGSGNRATVFFMTISLRVWKIFCNKEKEKKVVSVGHFFFQSLFLNGWACLIVSVFLNHWALESKRLLQFKSQFNAALVLPFIFFFFIPLNSQQAENFSKNISCAAKPGHIHLGCRDRCSPDPVPATPQNCLSAETPFL